MSQNDGHGRIVLQEGDPGDWRGKSATQQADEPLHIQRLRYEQIEMTNRLGKLYDFMLHNPIWHTLPPAEQRRMRNQGRIMELYVDVLADRLDAHFKGDK